MPSTIGSSILFTFYHPGRIRNLEILPIIMSNVKVITKLIFVFGIIGVCKTRVVKFFHLMDSITSQTSPAPPSLMKALMAGFDAISNHIGLILFSVVLDLVLWLGPRWHINGLFQDFFDRAAAMPEMKGQAEMFAQLKTMLQGFNLLSFLRTFPVGVPSLLAGQLAVESPLGELPVWRIASFSSAFGLWLLVALIGVVAGTLYFSGVAQAALSNRVTWRQVLSQWPWEFLQVLLLVIIWVAILVTIFVPLSCFMSVFLLSGLGLGQASLFFLLFAAVVVVWLLVPLVFAPHGIFVHRYATWASIRESIRLTRWTLPSTSFLLLVLVVLSEGLDVLWNIPAGSSWMVIIGIVGHAFVVTSLLASTFIYYRDADSWVKEMFKQTRLSSA